jgi:hypothetical protein
MTASPLRIECLRRMGKETARIPDERLERAWLIEHSSGYELVLKRVSTP